MITVAKPEAKPAKKETSTVASKNRVFEALVNHLDGVGDEGAQIAFLHSIGIDNERDVSVLLRRANEDDVAEEDTTA
jgi:hypothetical protein